MRGKLNRAIVCLLVMVITFVNGISGVFAVSNNGNYGGGSGNVSGRGTWSSEKQGYRICVVDDELNQVSNTVDILYSDPMRFNYGNGGRDFYTQTRAKGGGGWTGVLWSDLLSGGTIGSIPKAPIYFTGSQANAGGYEFRQWFLSGAAGDGFVPPAGVPIKPENGITTPDASDEMNPIDEDMEGVSAQLVFSNPVYRSTKKSEAVIKVERQGYLEHADTLIRERINSLISSCNYYVMKGKGTASQFYEIVLADEMENCNTVAKSNAEAIYMFASIIEGTAGHLWSPGKGIEVSEEVGVETASNIIKMDNIPLSNGDIIDMDPIPLDNEATGYWTGVINANRNGVFLFNVKRQESTSELPSQVITDNNYHILVEPIFWYIPAGHTNGRLSSPHSNYVYGTMGNFLDFYARHNYRFGNSGGHYPIVTTKLGWKSMFTNRDFKGRILPVGAEISTKGSIPLPTLKAYKDQGLGIGIHVYKTTPEVPANGQVTGYPHWTEPSYAPDPKDLQPPKDYKKEYNIVKYYRNKYLDRDGNVENLENVGVSLVTQNPPDIKIVSEKYYKVKDWYISKDNILTTPSESDYFEFKEKSQVNREGTSPESVQLEPKKTDPNDPNNGEKTLVVLLEKEIKPIEVDPKKGALTLYESEVSKSVSTANTDIENWGPKTFIFNYASMYNTDIHYCGAEDCSGHPCSAIFGDPDYKYVIDNLATINEQLETNGAGGAFKYKLFNNVKAGQADIKGGTNEMPNVWYETAIWRGKDIPTIASFKEKADINLKDLVKRYDKKPAGNRGTNGAYTMNLSIALGLKVAESDISTHSIHSYDGTLWITSIHQQEQEDPNDGEVLVMVYRGLNKKSPGRETVAKEILTTTPFGKASSLHSAGFMVQNITPIQFYPYIRMTYQTVGQKDKTNVNVLSQFYSEVLPNDFGEAAWYNPNESTSLTMSSTQWSLHARAVNNGQPWNGKNQVLPGGAIYQLGTGKTPSKVSLVTWQTVLDDKVRNSLYKTLPKNEYTLKKAGVEHDAFVKDAKAVLEELRVVQWVNAENTATNAWTNNGRSVKILDPGQSLGALGLTTKTNSEKKYILGRDKTTDAANEGDLDIISEVKSTDTYFKVFASPDGSIYMAKSVGDYAGLSDINGTNPNGKGNISVTKILSQTDKASEVDAKLNGDAKELNSRTKLITNLVNALERNTGNDPTAEWVSNGKWYNEAFDGIIVCRKATTLDVGFSNTSVRTAVLDPSLMPKNEGKSDLFSKAFLSQFRANERSDAKLAQGKDDGFIGTFQGKDIILKDMESLYQSKKFYIPNVSVQDLG